VLKQQTHPAPNRTKQFHHRSGATFQTYRLIIFRSNRLIFQSLSHTALGTNRSSGGCQPVNSLDQRGYKF
ncbi:hypothetical protein, partial [Arthrobacter flavus]